MLPRFQLPDVQEKGDWSWQFIQRTNPCQSMSTLLEAPRRIRIGTILDRRVDLVFPIGQPLEHRRQGFVV